MNSFNAGPRFCGWCGREGDSSPYGNELYAIDADEDGRALGYRCIGEGACRRRAQIRARGRAVALTVGYPYPMFSAGAAAEGRRA